MRDDDMLKSILGAIIIAVLIIGFGYLAGWAA